MTQALASQGSEVVVSRPFTIGDRVIACLRLYPKGSKARTQPGFCSLYLRCGAGSHLRFELFLGTVKHEEMECQWQKPNDRGRHDFCNFSEQFNALPAPRTLLCGADVLEIKRPSAPGALLS